MSRWSQRKSTQSNKANTPNTCVRCDFDSWYLEDEKATQERRDCKRCDNFERRPHSCTRNGCESSRNMHWTS